VVNDMVETVRALGPLNERPAPQVLEEAVVR